MRQGKLIAGILLSVSAGIGISGCWTGGVYQVPGKESLATDLTAEATPRVTRLQQQDPSDPKFRVPVAPSAPPPLVSPQAPPLPGNNGTRQVSLSTGKNLKVSVRAWVNGKPIFDEEVMQGIPVNVLREMATMPEPRRSERLSDAYNAALDGIIDQEVAYQDAVHKLESGNKQALGKLKKFADEEFEKQLKKIRDSNRATEEQIKDIKHTLKRQTERSLISSEYMRSRVFPLAVQRANHLEVQKYYEEHANEFQRLDSVQWQDVFIAVGPKYPTVAQAKRFAEDLIIQCRTDADFAKLIQFDDGDSKFRNGEGMGSRKGEIKPPEVEEVLFRLKEREIGPVIEISTGVHIVRVTKREVAGQIPLDEKTQKMIETKIKNQVAEREYKRIIRELRARSTIEVERDAP